MKTFYLLALYVVAMFFLALLWTSEAKALEVSENNFIVFKVAECTVNQDNGLFCEKLRLKYLKDQEAAPQERVVEMVKLFYLYQGYLTAMKEVAWKDERMCKST